MLRVMTAYVVCAVLLAAVLAFSARAKLVRDPKVQQSLDRAGVPHSWYAPLAATELAGALGLLVGIAWRPLGVAAAVGVGAIATAILVVNNLRDIPTDAESGKRTLAVRLGDTGTRRLWLGLIVASALAVGVMAVWDVWALLGLLSLAVVG